MASPMAMPSYPHENDGPRILGVCLMITIIALLTLILRLFVRIRMIRNVGWDDYTMIFAMTLCVAGVGVIVPEVYYGAGKHIDQIAPADFSYGFKLNFITQPIYLIAICVVKISVGFFLLRIAIIKFYRRLIQGIMVFMVFYTTACFFTVVLQCTNLAVMWDLTVKGTCWPTPIIKSLSYANVVCNITTDLLFAVIIPIPMLWNVQMNTRQKASIIMILSLGVFATVAAIIKFSFLPNYGRSGDWLWDSRDITIWVVLECNVGIIAGNLPCLKPLFKTVLGSTYGRGTRGRSGVSQGRLSGLKSLGRSSNASKLKLNHSGFFSSGTSKTTKTVTEITTVKTAVEGNSRSTSPVELGQKKIDGEEDCIEMLDQPALSHGDSMKMGEILRTTEVMRTESSLADPDALGDEEKRLMTATTLREEDGRLMTDTTPREEDGRAMTPNPHADEGLRTDVKDLV